MNFCPNTAAQTMIAGIKNTMGSTSKQKNLSFSCPGFRFSGISGRRARFCSRRIFLFIHVPSAPGSRACFSGISGRRARFCPCRLFLFIHVPSAPGSRACFLRISGRRALHCFSALL